jgi:hypothetical protein
MIDACRSAGINTKIKAVDLKQFFAMSNPTTLISMAMQPSCLDSKLLLAGTVQTISSASSGFAFLLALADPRIHMLS